mgnify:CR=1 FL=1
MVYSFLNYQLGFKNTKLVEKKLALYQKMVAAYFLNQWILMAYLKYVKSSGEKDSLALVQ